MENSERDERLAKARARIADIEGRRAARAAVAEAEAEVTQAERQARDLEALEAAEAAHGPVGKHIATVETSMGLVILRKSDPILFRRFQDAGEFKVAALTKLVDKCLVHPSSDEFDRILDELPAKLNECADAVAQLAGARAAEQAKK